MKYALVRIRWRDSEGAHEWTNHSDVDDWLAKITDVVTVGYLLREPRDGSGHWVVASSVTNLGNDNEQYEGLIAIPDISLTDDMEVLEEADDAG